MSCTELITSEFPDFKEAPTINALLITGKIIKVHVSLAEKNDTTFISLIDDARVIIKSDIGETDTLSLVSHGLYTSDLVAQAGVNYSIVVSIEGFEKISSSTKVLPPVHAKIVYHSNQYSYNEEGSYMEGLGIEFYDNPNSTDFYEIALIKRRNSSLNYVSAYNRNSVILLSEGFEPYSTSTLLLSDKLMKDSIINLILDYSTDGYGMRCYSNDSCVNHFDEHIMILELRHISESYYKYKKSFYMYEKERYPSFVEGTASTYPLFTNVDNGYGIFGSYSLTIDSLYIPQEFVPVK